MQKLLILYFLVLICSSRLGAQSNTGKVPVEFSPQAIFENFGLQDGLPGRSISNIIKDQQGFLWFSTTGGLVRYDGINFKAYQNKPSDTTSLSHNRLWALLIDHDNIIWVGTHGGGLNRFNPKRETFSVFPLGDNRKSADIIWSLTEDSQNRIWVSTKGNGLFIISADRNSVTHHEHDPEDSESLSGNSIMRVLEDSKGRFWVPVFDRPLNLFDPASGKAVHFRHDPNDPNSLASHHSVFHMSEDDLGRLWIPTDNGLSMLDMQDTIFTNYFHEPENPNSLSSSYIRSLELDGPDRVWLGTNKGLDLFYPKQEQFHHFNYQPFNPHSLANDFIRAIYKDQHSIFWIGTDNGLSKLVPRPFTFLPLISSAEEQRSNNSKNDFLEIFEGKDENMWMSTANREVLSYDPRSNSYRRISEFHAGFKDYHSIRRIWEGNSGQLLVSTTQGLHFYHDQSATIQPYCTDQTPACRLLSRSRVVELDRHGNFWIPTHEGLHRIEAGTGKITTYSSWEGTNPGILSSGVLFVKEDRYGRIWLAGEGVGLQFFDPGREQFIRVNAQEELPNNLAPASKPIFIVDSRGWVWIMDQSRLLRFQVDDSGRVQQFQQWLTRSGTIHEDFAGRFWLVHADGISLVDTLDGPQQTYSLKGITNTLDGSMGVTRSGHLYLGAYEGIYVFDPEQARLNIEKPPVVFTDFKISNQPVPIQGTFGDTLSWRSLLEQSISYTEEMTLPYNLNDFTIEFAALDFFQPELSQYKYLLEGYHSDTLFTTAERPFSSFTNLSPGKYTFRVWGSNNDGKWNTEDAKLSITILSPWYWSVWSKTAYLLLLLGILYMLYQFQLKRRVATVEAERLRELDQVKTNLYANITHEFRTPLTIILGMVRQIRTDPKKWYSEGLEMIHRNSRQLLHLVNQMLDLSKLEKGKLPLKPQRGELVAYLNYLVQVFNSHAASKNIQLHFLKEVKHLEMDYDPDQLSKIISNLLSNAIKFTPEGGHIYVSLRQNQNVPSASSPERVEISVKDTGRGIPEKDLPHIFNRFYQVENPAYSSEGGTGIGLSLVRQLVALMEGVIEVQSKPEEGTTFMVTLPVCRSAGTAQHALGISENLREEIPPVESSLSLSMPTNQSLLPASAATILLIEDNRDVMRYLASCLESKYHLEYANNGREGMEQAVELIPDLIISDVMMPEMDGYEVTATLKKDERTSHIPILLLTAKADRDSKIEGLQRGADAYLSKPFDPKELEVRLSTLMELRQKLQSRYMALKVPSDPRDAAFQQQDHFIGKFRKIIEDNIEDEAFGIMQITRKMQVSRTQLHNKLKALTGQSTSQVIRSIRLQRAKELLLTSPMNVSEVAYAVGFKNTTYFSSCFSEEFGLPPSELKNQRDTT